MMTEKRDEIMERESVMHHLFIDCLSRHLKGDGEFQAFLDEIGWGDPNKPDVETYLVVGNRKFPLKATCEFWDKQMDEMILKKAKELLDTEPFRRLTDISTTITEKLKADAVDLMGMKLNEDGDPIPKDRED